MILNKIILNKTFLLKAAILFDSLIWLNKLFHSFISLDPSTAKGMEIAMQLHRELIKSDFVRLMMFSEISKFLFVLTDNNCYWLVHNWISKEGLLLISNEPFLFFVSDNEEANHMKSYLHLGKPMPTNEAQRTKNIAWGEMELFVRETGSGSRDTTRHARS